MWRGPCFVVYGIETQSKFQHPSLVLKPQWPDDFTSAVSISTDFFFSLPVLILTCSCLGLPTDARSDDVSKFFEGYGRIIDCRVMTGSSDKRNPTNTGLNDKSPSGFGFVEFENAKAMPSQFISDVLFLTSRVGR